MEVPKIQLSASEIDLMNDASIILTKNSILNKIKELLENIQHQQVEYIRSGGYLQTSNVLLTPPKISRGESYLGLPYLILDYPRHSATEDLFFIRTMFWWGHYFSSTLHISGKSKSLYEKSVREHTDLLSQKDYYLGINEDPWVHHFEESNYKKITLLSVEEMNSSLKVRNHIKIAAKWPLNNVHLAAMNLYNSWKLFLRVTGLVT